VWGRPQPPPCLKSRLTEPQALADPALAQRRDDHIAEDREAAVEIWMRPVLGRDRLAEELAGRRLEGVVEADEARVAREDGSVREFQLLLKPLDRFRERDRAVPVVDRGPGATNWSATKSKTDLPVAADVKT
jgi:hypothetical protein